jgi:hypothetical protein
MKTTNQYYIEMTDTYDGEANYCWVNRFLVTASTMRGAMRKVSKETGYPAKMDYSTGDMCRYNVPKACICYFIQYSEGNESEIYFRVKTL